MHVMLTTMLTGLLAGWIATAVPAFGRLTAMAMHKARLSGTRTALPTRLCAMGAMQCVTTWVDTCA